MEVTVAVALFSLLAFTRIQRFWRHSAVRRKKCKRKGTKRRRFLFFRSRGNLFFVLVERRTEYCENMLGQCPCDKSANVENDEAAL
jgi:hypothetical protein